MEGKEMEEEVMKDMTPRLVLDLGLRFIPRGDRRYTYGLFECQYCGEEFECQATLVKTNRVVSCGCFSLTKPEGLSLSRFYLTWHNMIKRCTNPNNRDYKNYGGRGISVCEEWLDIRNFIEWAELTYSEGLSLDRINNDGNYEPNNCRWTDNSTQILNRRRMKNNKSGFVGIYCSKTPQFWVASITVKSKQRNIGTFKTIEEAVLARDNYIVENKLPHKLSTDYKKENK